MAARESMILLDTCTLLWLASEPDRLSASAVAAISSNVNALFVSSFSAFEIGIKSSKGKLKLSMPADEWFSTALRLHGLREIAISGSIAARSTLLPLLHQDPADRILVATALSHTLTIITPTT